MYTNLKIIHVAAVSLSIALFILRLAWAFRAPARLQRTWVRVVPHVIDTVLLGSAIGLTLVVHQYPFVNGWLTAKVMGLIAYIVFGTFALKRARSQHGQIVAACGALASVGYIVAVALTRNPFPIL